MSAFMRFLAFSTALLAAAVSANPDVVWRYEARTYGDGKGHEIPYRLFIPDE